PRIEAVVLGQHAAGAGELTKLVRVDTSHRQPRREQGTDDPALVTTARLKANRGDCERAQPCDQLGPPGSRHVPIQPTAPPDGAVGLKRIPDLTQNESAVSQNK